MMPLPSTNNVRYEFQSPNVPTTRKLNLEMGFVISSVALSALAFGLGITGIVLNSKLGLPLHTRLLITMGGIALLSGGIGCGLAARYVLRIDKPLKKEKSTHSGEILPHGDTKLLRAVREKSLKDVLWYLAWGANPVTPNIYNNTARPIIIATRNESIDIVKSLLKVSADPYNALEVAKKKNNAELIEILGRGVT